MISSRARSPAHMNGVVGVSSLDPEKYILCCSSGIVVHATYTQ